MPHTHPLEPNDPQRVGPYRLTGRLGVGGQGIVYLGTTESDETVAVKTLHSDWLRDASALDRLAKEVASARRVASFCTARVIDADLDAEPPYIVSEFIDGPTLLASVSEHGPLDESRLVRLAVGTATALAAIHGQGVAHRDFKPGNVILGPDGARVIDFGIARDQTMDVTGTSGIVGTPVYMAPEHFLGERVDQPADMFAWASTMVYAGTGKGPFTAPSLPAIMHRVINDEPALGELPEPLAGLIGRCLTKDPGARPTSRDVLLGLLDGTTRPTTEDGAVFEAAASQAAGAAPAVPPDASAAPTGPPSSGQAPPGPMPPGQASTGPTPPAPPTPSGPMVAAGPPYGPGPHGPRPGWNGAPTPPPPARAPRKTGRRLLAGIGAGLGAVVLVAGAAFVIVNRSSDGAAAVGSGRGGAAPASAAPNTAEPSGQDTLGDAPKAGGKKTKSGTPSADRHHKHGATSAQVKKKRKKKRRQAAEKSPKRHAHHSEPRPSDDGPHKKPRDNPPPRPKPNPYTPAQACGSGYRVLESHPLKLRGARVATVYLMYKNSNGYNCVVTLRSDQRLGKASGHVSAFLKPKGRGRVSDGGAFKYYAGPARAHAAKTCVKWGGTFAAGGTASYSSPYMRCG